MSILRAAVAATSSLLLVAALAAPRVLVAQDTWNDERTMALVRAATLRRSVQLADTGLRDYSARATGFITFLAQFGDGFLARPVVVKADQLELEVYWSAPNRSKQTIVGRRDYAMLLLLVTYGLRAREIAALTLDDLDWRHDRLRVPERKAGHSTAYPLSPLVGHAILEYLQNGRPATSSRHILVRTLAPCESRTQSGGACRAAH